MSESVRPSGHLKVRNSATGQRWHALWRDAEGRHQKILGPAWVKDSGRRTPRGAVVWHAANGPKPDPSYLTPADASDRLRTVLAGAPRAIPAGARRRGPLFATVAWQWLEHGERRRGLKQSTLKDYRYLIRNHLLPAFGERPLRAITRKEIERWQAGYERARTAAQALMILGAILRYGQRRELIAANPIDGVERHPVRDSGDYDMYSREEIDAIVRCAADDQDAAIYLTAALTGLRRGELLALRWRDIDFPGQAIRVRGNLSYGQITTPKSGKVRVVPMVDEVAHRLARLAGRELQTGDDDPVFASPLSGHLDPSALRRRFVAAVTRAGLRVLPFHPLRHFFGSMAVNKASLVGRGQGPAQAANPHPKRDRLWTTNPHPRPHLGPLARCSVRPSRQQAGADGAHVRTCDAAPSAHRASAPAARPPSSLCAGGGRAPRAGRHERAG